MNNGIDWRRSLTGFAGLMGPPLGWFLLFFAVPMAVVWAYSFGTNVGISDIEISGTFANYARALEPLYLGILGKSLAFAALATLICLVIGFPVALAISFAPPRLKTWLLIGVMLPFWTNLLIRTYALIALLRDEGLINHGLELAFGWAGFEPLRMMHTNFAVMVGLVYVHLPFTVLPLYAALDRLDRSLLEASLDLGAGHIRTIWNIVLPLASAGIASAILLTFIPVLGSYLAPDLLGGPDSQMIANVIERQFKRANDWPFGAALAFMLMYLTLFGIAMQSLLKRRERPE
ncbi:ABC transporter permease [Sandaracinobacter sp. RS1-74]|uniref:ABC transporter permease n=1 Tax=Sandaracinobacteroides sayramensis TaxID=2913411 RepID=UPI001EDB99BA|nr:ABC transporter permease [Sandaracinobacteroides sayramensis]MCG2839743.1 ABC transporter permease [Sandaracinobacteroides sayramensis]